MKNLLWIIIAAIVVIGGYYFYTTSSSNEAHNNMDAEMVVEDAMLGDDVVIMGEEGMMKETPVVDAATLAQHNSIESCWVVYEQGVYDVTAFVPKHPGGADEITPFCGVADGSFEAAFMNQHGEAFVAKLKTEAGVYQGFFVAE